MCKLKEDGVYDLTACGNVNLLGDEAWDRQEVLTT